jgi:hypothetical protein
MGTLHSLRRDLRIALLSLALAAPAPALADQGGGKQPAGGASQSADRGAAPPSGSSPILLASNMPVFVPPNRGAPLSRLGGATRSAGASGLPRIEAMVPEQPGWTLEAQPVLYWHLEAPTDVRVEFVLMRLEPHQVLVDTALPRPAAAGIQRIALADHGASLEPGADYQWLVKLASRPHVLAQAGIWYDAVDALSRQIDAEPGNALIVKQRTALFSQVGLPEETH